MALPNPPNFNQSSQITNDNYWPFEKSGFHGYWGPPTSTVDWCETNYAISYYIAEFFNSTSNLITISCGLFLCAFAIKNKLEFRFALASLALSLVGLGSLAFHGTLLIEAQMLDEIPMVYLALVFSYCVFENGPKRQYFFIRPLLIAIGIAYSFIHLLGKFFVIFHVIFGVLLAPVVIYPLQFLNDPHLGKIVVTMLSLFAAAFTAWKFDQIYCPDLEKLYLHSVWHIFTAVSAGLWIMCMMYIRLRYTYNKNVTFKYVFGFIPFIQRDADDVHYRRHSSVAEALKPSKMAKALNNNTKETANEKEEGQTAGVLTRSRSKSRETSRYRRKISNRSERSE